MVRRAGIQDIAQEGMGRSQIESQRDVIIRLGLNSVTDNSKP